MKFLGRELAGPPIVVAEIGAGHGGDIDRACELILAAKNCGADAIKIQTYSTEAMTIRSNRPEFVVESPLWQGQTLWDLYAKAQTPLSWLPKLFDVADTLEIPLFSSVFDLQGLTALENCRCPAYKIASFELVDTPLIAAVARCNKPMVLSAGMATQEEIAYAMQAIPFRRFRALGLLHCVSAYPCPIEEANLAQMVKYQRIHTRYHGQQFVGVSDHTMGVGVPTVATALGAKMIEKHLCLRRADGGPDAEFSMEPWEFSVMVGAIKQAWEAMQPSMSVAEAVNRKYRRSLYVVEAVKAGEIFTLDNVRSIRPANGLEPRRIEEVLGRRASVAIEEGTPLSMDMVEDFLQPGGHFVEQFEVKSH